MLTIRVGLEFFLGYVCFDIIFTLPSLTRAYFITNYLNMLWTIRAHKQIVWTSHYCCERCAVRTIISWQPSLLYSFVIPFCSRIPLDISTISTCLAPFGYTIDICTSHYGCERCVVQTIGVWEPSLLYSFVTHFCFYFSLDILTISTCLERFGHTNRSFGPHITAVKVVPFERTVCENHSSYILLSYIFAPLRIYWRGKG